jgi:hypothetical protein
VEVIGTTIQELGFLLIRAGELKGGQLKQEFTVVREPVKRRLGQCS